jgi:hypothetical protein
MIRWTTLQQELIHDPLKLGYSQYINPYDEAGLLSLLNSVSVMAPASKMHSERGVLDKYPDGPIAADMVLQKIEGFAATSHPMAGIVRRALKFLGQPEGIDFGAPSTQTLLSKLADGGVITRGEATKLINLGTMLISRGEQLGLKVVGGDQVHAAIFDENGDRIIG